MIITKEYLRNHLNHIFVFGDNTIRRGYGGAAALRDEPNTYGFITKKFPDNEVSSFYTVDEYKKIFENELFLLEEEILKHPDKLYLISPVGSGLANKFGIFEAIIDEGLKYLKKYINVKFLY